MESFSAICLASDDEGNGGASVKSRRKATKKETGPEVWGMASRTDWSSGGLEGEKWKTVCPLPVGFRHLSSWGSLAAVVRSILQMLAR